MFEIEGENATATIMADYEHISEDTITQIHMLVSHPSIQSDFVVQADGHKASGAVVGFTMPLGTRIAPTLIGYDIGCGMHSFNIGETLPLEDSNREVAVRDAVPTGRGIHSARNAPDISDYPWDEANRLFRRFKKAYKSEFGKAVAPSFSFDGYDESYLDGLLNRVNMNKRSVTKAAGTLGSGNHFIEFGQSSKTDEYWCTIHSGSRHLGRAVGKHHAERAHELREGDSNRGDTQLDWLEESEAYNYFVDMVFCQTYATWNRRLMQDAICNELDVSATNIIEAPHNYIDFQDMIVRKGATAAREESKLVVPLNMSDGILLGTGKGSQDHLQTSPHGAGRVVSRNQAKQDVDLDEFKDRMDNVYSESITESLLDESPQAYKNATYIKNELEKTVTITDHIIPRHNIKGN